MEVEGNKKRDLNKYILSLWNCSEKMFIISKDDFILHVFTANTSCDTGWILFSDACYKIVMTQMTYSDAVNNCHSLGGDIIIVNNTMQQSFFSSKCVARFLCEF